MMEPTFLAQYLFVYCIKSTYQIDAPGTKNLNLGANTVPHGAMYLCFRFKAKIREEHFSFWQDIAIFHFQHGQNENLLHYF